MLLGGSTPRSRSIRLWIVVLAFLVPAGGRYALARTGALGWPSGTRAEGFWCGVVAGAIVLIEMLLWVRKKLRGRRRFLGFPLGMTKTWMAWHVWLGLAAIPLAVVHSGFAWGGWLSAWTLGLFLAVSVSGVLLLWMQQVLPRRLFDVVPEETIASQIDSVMTTYCAEAEQPILALLDPAPAFEASFPGASGRTLVKPLASGSVAAVRLRSFYLDQVRPYLRHGLRSTQLRSAERARLLFGEVLRETPEHAHEHIRNLERLCGLRRQLDRQWWIDLALHVWLLIHFPLSIVLTAFLVWHAAAALKLW